MYSEANLKAAVDYVRTKRAEGLSMELMKKDNARKLEEYEAYAKRNHIAKIIDMDGMC